MKRYSLAEVCQLLDMNTKAVYALARTYKLGQRGYISFSDEDLTILRSKKRASRQRSE